MSTQLTVQHRAAVALQSDKARAELTALAASSQSIKAPTNPEGRAECHAAAMAAAAARIAIVKAGKDARDDATQFSKAVIAEEARLVAIIQPEETRLKALRDAYDADQARIKAEKAEAERLRVLEIIGRIARIKQAAIDAARFDVSADAASEIHAGIRAIEIDATFAEFYGEAVEAKAVTLAEIAKIIESNRQAEAAASKAEADRIELERVRKAEAEAARIKARQEAAARAEQARAEAAALKAAQEKIDADRKEIAAREAKFAAERASALAEIDAKRRAQDDKERAANEARISEEAKAEAAKSEAARVELERIATARRQKDAADRLRIAAINDKRAAVSAMLDAVDDEDVIEEIFAAVRSIVERAAERIAA